MKFNFWCKEKELPLINILTRTSNRPNGFKICHNSIEAQNYDNFKHIVSYDTIDDLNYLKKYEITKIKVDRSQLIREDKSEYSSTNMYSPHNLYCNYLLDNVNDGWVMFLDDDDMLAHKKVLKFLAKMVRRYNSDTLFIWQMRYPRGRLLPTSKMMKKKELKIGFIGSPCFLVHSSYAKKFKWDSGKCADYRYLEKIFDCVPNKVWIRKPFTRLNNEGDLGHRNDIQI